MLNDELDHHIRDGVVRELARRLQHCVRSYDMVGMVGRFGGEEFLVNLNNCDAKGVLGRAENIRMEVAKKPFETRAKPLTTTISVGLAFSTDFENKTPDEIPGRRRFVAPRSKGRRPKLRADGQLIAEF